jgi:hypothetical protein
MAVGVDDGNVIAEIYVVVRLYVRTVSRPVTGYIVTTVDVVAYITR